MEKRKWPHTHTHSFGLFVISLCTDEHSLGARWYCLREQLSQAAMAHPADPSVGCIYSLQPDQNAQQAQKGATVAARSSIAALADIKSPCHCCTVSSTPTFLILAETFHYWAGSTREKTAAEKNSKATAWCASSACLLTLLNAAQVRGYNWTNTNTLNKLDIF